jgi:hypothetical protein
MKQTHHVPFSLLSSTSHVFPLHVSSRTCDIHLGPLTYKRWFTFFHARWQIEYDRLWLLNRCSTRLPRSENAEFNAGKHIVATNKYLSAMFGISHRQCEDGWRNFHKDNHEVEMDGEHFSNDGPQLYAIGAEAAEVLLTTKLWSEIGQVNSANGKFYSIFKPPDDREARILMIDFPSGVPPWFPHCPPTTCHSLWSFEPRL